MIMRLREHTDSPGRKILEECDTSSLCYIPCRSSDHHNLSLLFCRHITAKYELFKNETVEPRNLGNKNVNRIENMARHGLPANNTSQVRKYHENG
jgi:hypothetical protein